MGHVGLSRCAEARLQLPAAVQGAALPTVSGKRVVAALVDEDVELPCGDVRLRGAWSDGVFTVVAAL